MTVTLEFRPKLRWPLDIQPLEFEGEKGFLMRDQLGVAEETLVVPAPILQLLLSLDGRLSVREWGDELRESGADLEQFLSFVSELERIGFLESETSAGRWRMIQEEFDRMSVRAAAFAGTTYPESPEALRDYIEKFLKLASPVEKPTGRELWGVICPHIDYQRGGRTYARTYRLLENFARPDLIVLIGTGHQPSNERFTFTRKAFDTPLGRFDPDHTALDILSSSVDPAHAFANEILHRKEHSLELQLPFLAHLFQSRGETFPEILPVLVSSFENDIVSRTPPDTDEQFSSAVEGFCKLKQQYQESGKNVWFFGGIDLAHVGQHFGDDEQAAPDRLPVVAAADQHLLHSVCTLDRKALFEHVAADGDSRKICGFPTLYTLLSVADQLGDKLYANVVEYHQAVDEQNDCVVTFASACWTSPAEN